MKKGLILIISFMFVVSMIFMGAGCKAEEAVEEAEEAVEEAEDVEEEEEEKVVAEDEKVFYWITHGSEADAAWRVAGLGARQAAELLNVKLNQSFHANDVNTQKEAFMAGIADNATGIASTSPEQGVLIEEVSLAKEKGIPVILFNTDDPTTGRDTYIGNDDFKMGKLWAEHLVNNELVGKGDKVWMPVEVPGATYGVLETQGIASVFDPLGIEYEVFDASYEPAEIINRMTDYLIAHGSEVDAIICLGDLTAASMPKVFENIGWSPGEVPAAGYGCSVESATAVKQGYLSAGGFPFGGEQGFLTVTMLYMISEGFNVSFEIPTTAVYTTDEADQYIEYLKSIQ